MHSRPPDLAVSYMEQHPGPSSTAICCNCSSALVAITSPHHGVSSHMTSVYLRLQVLASV